VSRKCFCIFFGDWWMWINGSNSNKTLIVSLCEDLDENVLVALMSEISLRFVIMFS
jgi:hypothetical protein